MHHAFKALYFLSINLFIWLHLVLIAALGIFSCDMQTLSWSMWDLVARLGIKPGPPALGAQSLVTGPPGKSQGILKSIIKFWSVRHTDQAWLRSESESGSVMSDFLRPHGLFSPWNSPGQNTGVDSLSILQRIFLTQELRRDLLHCRDSLPAELTGKPWSLVGWLYFLRGFLPLWLTLYWACSDLQISGIAGNYKLRFSYISM